MNQTGTIAFLRDVKREGINEIPKNTVEQVEVLYVGVRGGFERHGEDGTMEGAIVPIAIVRFIATGLVNVFELDYEILLIIQ